MRRLNRVCVVDWSPTNTDAQGVIHKEHPHFDSHPICNCPTWPSPSPPPPPPRLPPPPPDVCKSAATGGLWSQYGAYIDAILMSISTVTEVFVPWKCLTSDSKLPGGLVLWLSHMHYVHSNAFTMKRGNKNEIWLYLQVFINVTSTSYIGIKL